MKSGLIQRLFARFTPYQFHVNGFIGQFQSVDGRFELVMDSEMRRRFGGTRNLLLDLEFLEQDSEKPRYWILPKYLATFFEVKSKSASTADELQGILRAREKLGREAELEILKFELVRLRHNPGLEKRIKHVAAEDVGAGYDILSFTESADRTEHSDRLIEVKAVSAVDFKFYWSRNEIETARTRGKNYFLYLLPVARCGFDIQGLRIIRNPFEKVYQNRLYWHRQDELVSCWPKSSIGSPILSA